jgi:hypothetical protein
VEWSARGKSAGSESGVVVVVVIIIIIITAADATREGGDSSRFCEQGMCPALFFNEGSGEGGAAMSWDDRGRDGMG